MNSITRAWLNWKHGRKFATRGGGHQFAFPDLLVSGRVEMGAFCHFRNNVVLRTFGSGRIVLGNRSGFSWNCVVLASSLIEIGHRTGIAENTVLCDTIYDFFGHEGGPRDVPKRAAPIHIGDNVFIGSGCYIGPGVTVADGAVIAHHSIVTRDVGPYEIWGGRPARKMSHRTEGVPENIKQEVEALIARFGVLVDRQEGRYEY